MKLINHHFERDNDLCCVYISLHANSWMDIKRRLITNRVDYRVTD